MQFHPEQLYFPAVTLCLSNMFDVVEFNLSNVEQRFMNGENISQREEIGLVATRQIRDEPWSIGPEETSFNMTTSDFMKTFAKIATNPLRGSKIEFNREYILAREEFRKLITGKGLCYTINMLHGDDLFTDNIDKSFRMFDYNEKFRVSLDSEKSFRYPRNMTASGMTGGLSLSLKIDKIIYESSYTRGDPHLFVRFHPPYEYPDLSKSYIRVRTNVDLHIIIKPRVLFTPNDLRKYPVNTRQCFFEDERKLTFFKHYTQVNCETECEAAYILKQCGCVKNYMPHTNSTRICQSYAEMQCLFTNLHQYLGWLEDLKACNCQPSCFDIQFDYELNSITLKDNQ